MVRLDAGCGIGLQIGTGEVARMSADEFAARARGLHDAAHAGHAAEHAPHVHQLGRAVDRLPAEHAAERVGVEIGTCLLETGGGGGARRCEHEDPKREVARGLDRPSDTFQAGDVAELVRVPADRGGALRHHVAA